LNSIKKAQSSGFFKGGWCSETMNFVNMALDYDYTGSQKLRKYTAKNGPDDNLAS